MVILPLTVAELCWDDDRHKLEKNDLRLVWGGGTVHNVFIFFVEEFLYEHQQKIFAR